jgi:hypothetical protein
MRMGLVAAVVGVLVLASSAGADVVLNFGTTGGSGFNLSSGGVLSFPNGPIQDTDVILQNYVIRIGSMTIDPTTRATPFSGLVTYGVTTPSVIFQIWDPTDTIEYLTATLATNTISIYHGGPLVFDGSTFTANLSSVSLLNGGSSNADLAAIHTAGSAGVTLTLNRNIDAQLSGHTAVSGDLSGSVDVSVVPEPATLALTGLGIMALFIRRKK